MVFEKLTNSSVKLLRKLVSADNPTKLLCRIYENGSPKKKDELRCIIQELSKKGYIKVSWADNLPWYVIINNSARTYDERFEEDLSKQSDGTAHVINDNSIHIGDGNIIPNTTIANRIDKSIHTTTSKEKKGFFKRHPVLIEIFIGVFVAFVMMFSFWEKIVNWIEGVF